MLETKNLICNSSLCFDTKAIYELRYPNETWNLRSFCLYCHTGFSDFQMPPVAPGFPKTYSSSTFQSTSNADVEKISPLSNVYSTPKKVNYLHLFVLASYACSMLVWKVMVSLRLKLKVLSGLIKVSSIQKQFLFCWFVHDWNDFLTVITVSLSFMYCLNLLLFYLCKTWWM